MQNRINDKINIAIMDNELSATGWGLNQLAWTLYWFVDFFDIVFFKDQPVPIPVLTFEKTRVNSLGYYRVGLNDFAVKEQINLNRLYINSPLSALLQTLIHEMVHSWEFLYVDEKKRTKNWYHKMCFRKKMADIGILTNAKGCHLFIQDPFIFLLRKHGVDFSNYTYTEGSKKVIVIPPTMERKGKSKLMKWSCGCTNLRVGIKDLEAKCLKCENKFELVT